MDYRLDTPEGKNVVERMRKAQRAAHLAELAAVREFTRVAGRDTRRSSRPNS